MNTELLETLKFNRRGALNAIRDFYSNFPFQFHCTHPIQLSSLPGLAECWTNIRGVANSSSLDQTSCRLVNGFLQVTWKSFQALFRTTPWQIVHQTVLFLAFNGYPAGITSFIRTCIINRRWRWVTTGIASAIRIVLDPHPDSHF